MDLLSDVLNVGVHRLPLGGEGGAHEHVFVDGAPDSDQERLRELQ